MQMATQPGLVSSRSCKEGSWVAKPLTPTPLQKWAIGDTHPHLPTSGSNVCTWQNPLFLGLVCLKHFQELCKHGSYSMHPYQWSIKDSIHLAETVTPLQRAQTKCTVGWWNATEDFSGLGHQTFILKSRVQRRLLPVLAQGHKSHPAFHSS